MLRQKREKNGTGICHVNTESPVHSEFSAVHFENILRTESGHPLRLTYGGISIYDKNIPELYQKAMLWKDWKEASKGQRR